MDNVTERLTEYLNRAEQSGNIQRVNDCVAIMEMCGYSADFEMLSGQYKVIPLNTGGEGFRSNPECETLFYSCVYNGISSQIDFYMRGFPEEDHTAELQYIVERYCSEYVISGAYLREKLQKYIGTRGGSGV